MKNKRKYNSENYFRKSYMVSTNAAVKLDQYCQIIFSNTLAINKQ